MPAPRYDKSHIGRRVKYTDREGRERFGVMRDVLDGCNSVDVAIDGMSRPRYYVPDDTVELVDEPAGATE